MNMKMNLKGHVMIFGLLYCLLVYSCKDENKEVINTTPTEEKFALEGLSIDDLQQKMQSGEMTSHAIVQMYLDRIKMIDKSGPALNAIIELNPDALAIADSLDKERKEKKVRGPMHGIPVLLKDNIDTGDKMHTTAGSLAIADNIASQDAFIVKKLRAAGAIILGKTNLSEWANFRSSRSSSGWSSRGGQTRNPYLLDRSPCGSSSGSGVAVAADLCVVAIGTETDGSIACPASMNGVVGIKPTVGLCSRSGIIPISKTQDTPGPLCKTVKDAAILLSVMTGVDSTDVVTEESNGKSKTDYTAFLDVNGLKGKRIGVEKSLLHNHEGVDALTHKAIEQMKSQGAIIVEVEFMKKTQEWGDKEFDIMKYEFKDGLNHYLATANSKMKSIDDVIKFNKENSATAMPYFVQEIMDSSVVKEDLSSKGYAEAMKELPAVRKILDDVMSTNKLDALCGPATGPAWCIDLIAGDHWTGYGAYGPAAMGGYPSITVPMGLVSELPVGISFLGRPYDESGLLAIAYAYEQVSKNRVAPKFLTSFPAK